MQKIKRECGLVIIKMTQSGRSHKINQCNEADNIFRWHPEFDLNGLDLPPAAELPKPPASSRVLSANEMLQHVDSNKALPPPGVSCLTL